MPVLYLYLNELEEPLTPSHLVIGKRLLSIPGYNSEEEKFSNETPYDARKREQYLSRVMTHYWRRWRRAYLVDLREYQRIQGQGLTMEMLPQLRVRTTGIDFYGSSVELRS